MIDLPVVKALYDNAIVPLNGYNSVEKVFTLKPNPNEPEKTMIEWTSKEAWLVFTQLAKAMDMEDMVHLIKHSDGDWFATNDDVKNAQDVIDTIITFARLLTKVKC